MNIGTTVSVYIGTTQVRPAVLAFSIVVLLGHFEVNHQSRVYYMYVYLSILCVGVNIYFGLGEFFWCGCHCFGDDDFGVVMMSFAGMG